MLKYLAKGTLVSNICVTKTAATCILSKESIAASLELSLLKPAKTVEKSMHCLFAMPFALTNKNTTLQWLSLNSKHLEDKSYEKTRNHLLFNQVLKTNLPSKLPLGV